VALDLGVSIPTIAASIDARVLSSMKDERVRASKVFSDPSQKPAAGDRKSFVKDVHDALYASKICSYAQGMSLIAAGSTEYRWGIDLREMARIWKGGCIIRARFLDDIMRAYQESPSLANLLLDSRFSERISESSGAWRRMVSFALQSGIAVPSMSASLAYFDSYRTPRLPQNLTQAQRDLFGAHTYERADKPELGFVHTEWKP
jgi:6-phosphogluconate dehydrogenase